MSKRNLQNQNLERVARRLLAAGKARSEEIERVVSSPALFEAVKTKIEAERRRQAEEQSPRSGLAKLPFSYYLKPAFVSAVLLLFLVTAAVMWLDFSRLPELADRKAATGEKLTAEIPPEFSAGEPPAHLSPQILKADFRPHDEVRKVKRASFASKIPPPSKAARNRDRTKSAPAQNLPPVKFYAVGFTDMPGGSGEELQIVRAELSRSELFALGVNLPIENGPEKIKTDLLVGRDGVARAIRLVE